MSIHLRLGLAFAFVILLALVLAGLAFVVGKRPERERQALDRLAAVAPQVTIELRALQRSGAPPEQISELVRQAARQRDVRVLLVDRMGVITEDSEGRLTGQSAPLPQDPEPRRATYRTVQGRDTNGEPLVFLIVPQAQFLRQVRPNLPEPRDTVVLAVPADTVGRAWRELLPGLLWAGSIALVASLIVATVLARSLARPMTLLTRASEAMARGEFDHEIPVRGGDEVGRLALAFNTMAREVGRGHLRMRALLANVSHDLKTPMTSILGFSQAIRDRAVDQPDEIVETAAIIHAEAERVQALVGDLLYLSELDAGLAPVTIEPVDLAALARRCLRRQGARLDKRGLVTTFEGSERVVALGDTAKLERVLDNLIDNAIKYTPAGGRVAVRVRDGDAPTIDVLNTGAPIPREAWARLFDRFERLDRSRGGTAGSGLGLAIAKELVELQGGAISVFSDAGGTVFTVTLPPAGAADARPVERADTPGRIRDRAPSGL